MGGSDGPLDPLSEAFVLGRKAVTARQRLQALEAIRSATKLALKGTTVDREQTEQLDRNLRDVEREYRDAPTFDLAVRALQGVREAALQKIAPAGPADPVDRELTVADSGGRPLGEPHVYQVSSEEHWRGVPRRYRDLDASTVSRSLQLHLASSHARRAPDETIEVRERSTGALAWREP
jgi:hypothetical protein